MGVECGAITTLGPCSEDHAALAAHKRALPAEAIIASAGRRQSVNVYKTGSIIAGRIDVGGSGIASLETAKFVHVDIQVAIEDHAPELEWQCIKDTR